MTGIRTIELVHYCTPSHHLTNQPDPVACAERLKNTKLRLGTLLNNESRSKTPQNRDLLLHGVVERRERVKVSME